MDEIKYYTRLGALDRNDLGLDAEGDIMALADYVSKDGTEDRTVCLVIRANGTFEVHPLEDVPMTWPVCKAKLMLIAAPVSEEDFLAARERRENLAELGEQIAKELG